MIDRLNLMIDRVVQWLCGKTLGHDGERTYDESFVHCSHCRKRLDLS